MILTRSYHGTTGSDVEMQFCTGKSSVSNPCAVVSVARLRPLEVFNNHHTIDTSIYDHTVDDTCKSRLWLNKASTYM